MRSVALSTGLLALALLVAAEEQKPTFQSTSIKGALVEQFTDDWASRWTPSEATKKTPVGTETFSYVGQWKVEEPSTLIIEGDMGLVAKSKAAHHAISAPLKAPLDFKNKPLVVQYEVKYQKGGNCGGGYIKLLEDGFQSSPREFSDKTPWVVMFGPDLTCPGTKLHLIFRHKNPITGEYEEKHLTGGPVPSIEKATKLYTLAINPDNTYSVTIDNGEPHTGSLLTDFNPPVNPSKEIDDSEDKKPSDWVDTKRIPDPDATKPDDWDEDAAYEVLDEDAVKPEGWLDDEPQDIPDPDSEKPEEWDDEEDGDWIGPTVANPKCSSAPGCGEWKRPMKPNPAYRGKWYAPTIDNPEYKGEWAPRKIDNPGYFEDNEPVKSLEKIGGVGIELWTMTEDILFDNLYIGQSLQDAKKLAEETFEVKKKIEEDAKKAEQKAEAEEAGEVETIFTQDPVGYVREKVFEFVELAKIDPVFAVKVKPEVASALGLVVLFFVGAIISLVSGGSPKPSAPSKKNDAPTPDDETTTETTSDSNKVGDDQTDTPLRRRK
jgi:hypothetical protein